MLTVDKIVEIKEEYEKIGERLDYLNSRLNDDISYCYPWDFDLETKTFDLEYFYGDISIPFDFFNQTDEELNIIYLVIGNRGMSMNGI